MAIGSIDLQEQQRLRRRSAKSAKQSLISTENSSAPSSLSSRRSKIYRQNLLPKPSSPTKKEISEIPINLNALSRTLDRYGVSDRASAAIASSVLDDFGVLHDDDLGCVIDRSRIRRARETTRQIAAGSKSSNTLFGFYFDGRKDKTLKMDDNRRQVVLEEHIVLVGEPGSIYVGHVVPKTGSAADITESMWELIKDSPSGLTAVGCDGTNVNTGIRGGVVILLEHKLNRPLKWLICQLHANELPLRHLIKELDGETNGPRGFTGPIGKALEGCEKLAVKSFEKIESADIPIILKTDLSWEQKYLYEMCHAISSGVCSAGLAKRNPGKVVHSRWITTANRILRLYISTNTPSENLKVLATFIMRVYAPSWFSIKARPSCVKGAIHLHEMIQRSRYLPSNIKNIIDPVLQRNAYFGHCENLLLAMLFDSHQYVRELGLRRILKARELPVLNLRRFSVPVINFSAKEYYDLISWQDITITEPPLLAHLSVEALWQLVRDPDNKTIAKDILKLPSHTQAVERAVKVVSEASLSVCGSERRDGVIRNKMQARSLMPKFNTKKEYHKAT